MWDMARITVSLLQVPPDQAINELTELNFSTPFLGINFLKIPKEVSWGFNSYFWREML